MREQGQSYQKEIRAGSKGPVTNKLGANKAKDGENGSQSRHPRKQIAGGGLHLGNWTREGDDTCCQGGEKGSLAPHCLESKLLQLLWKRVCGFFLKIFSRVGVGPSILTAGCVLGELHGNKMRI